MVTTPGQLLVNDALPQEYRDYKRKLGKSDTDKLLGAIAKHNPEYFREVSYNLMELGRNAAFDEGTTLRLRDIRGVVDRQPILDYVDAKEAEINASGLSDDIKQDMIDDLYAEATEALRDQTYEAAVASDNPFALQVKSKARGNPDQLAALLTTPGTYKDSHDRTVPMFIRRSYAQGLMPHEYWAATYGARRGVVSTKFATRDAGYLGKLLGTAAMDVVVTEDDCGTSRGIPVAVDDNDSIGAELAVDQSGFSAGTVVTKEVLAKLDKSGAKRLLVKSPMTCDSSKGVCRHCIGVRETGKLPPIGYNVGTNAASAFAEQIAQSALNVKHSGKKQGGLTTYSGFDVIKNLATVPSNYPYAATVAESDGTVTDIVKAPQGGNYIYVDDIKHYASPGMAITVKPGDVVEAGDRMSDGVVNPYDVVRLKGVGEGRRYFADRITEAYRDSNIGGVRRNAEVLARAIVDHVTIEDADAAGAMLPGETTTYSSWERGYAPRATAITTKPKSAIGKYLEAPALHYTVGTRITPSVASSLAEFGNNEVLVADEPPGVVPTMVSVAKTPEYLDDWMARLGSSYLETRLLNDIRRGGVSRIHDVHPGPGIARGVDFGQPRRPKDTYTY